MFEKSCHLNDFYNSKLMYAVVLLQFQYSNMQWIKINFLT